MSLEIGNDSGHLQVGQLIRYNKTFSPGMLECDGLQNFIHLTRSKLPTKVLLEKGINTLPSAWAAQGERKPAILIGSSPHKVGTDTTPWRDIFEPDRGRVLYYGDNKRPGVLPGSAPGNGALLRAFEMYSSPHEEVRRLSPPLVFFQRAAHNKRTKGVVRFQGFGVVRAIKLVAQAHPGQDETFSNYAYECVLFSLAAEGERLPWAWINARREPALSADQADTIAPESWKRWVREGEPSLEACRRHVTRSVIPSKEEQLPLLGSPATRALEMIYRFYSEVQGRKHRFELLAARVVARVLGASEATYHLGWVTIRSGDGGVDFVSRLDLGSGFSSVKVVVLGQAKCETIASPTNGRDVARIVARLRRGWIGAYVTTSFFSEAAQRELVDDQYPVLLINGRRLAEEVLAIATAEGCTVEKLLEQVDAQYEQSVADRRPEEIVQL